MKIAQNAKHSREWLCFANKMSGSDSLIRARQGIRKPSRQKPNIAKPSEFAEISGKLTFATDAIFAENQQNRKFWAENGQIAVVKKKILK